MTWLFFFLEKSPNTRRAADGPVGIESNNRFNLWRNRLDQQRGLHFQRGLRTTLHAVPMFILTHRSISRNVLDDQRGSITSIQSHRPGGGNVNFGPPRSCVLAGVGPGAPIAGQRSQQLGLWNYTEWKFSKKDFLSLRPLDIRDDQKGERSGLHTTYVSFYTVGVTHQFNELISPRSRSPIRI